MSFFHGGPISPLGVRNHSKEGSWLRRAGGADPGSPPLSVPADPYTPRSPVPVGESGQAGEGRVGVSLSLHGERVSNNNLEDLRLQGFCI